MTANKVTPEMNPFLMPYDTPYGAIPYDRITLGHYIPAIKEGIAREEKIVESICNSNDDATFENTIAALDYAGLMLGDVIGAFNAVANACSNDEVLAIEEEMQQLYVAHKNNITLNEKLFARVKAVFDGDIIFQSLNIQRLKIFFTFFVRTESFHLSRLSFLIFVLCFTPSTAEVTTLHLPPTL